MAKKEISNADAAIAKVLTSEESRKKIKEALSIITHHMQLIDDQKEAISEIVTELHEQTGVEKKLIRKLARTMYAHDYSNVVQEHQTFEAAFELIVNGKLEDDSDVE